MVDTDELRQLMQTGDPKLDRWIDRIVHHLVRTLGDEATPEIGRALVGIVWKESKGVPGLVGDKDPVKFKGGPSVGLMQVYRSTAKALGLWSPSRVISLQTKTAKQEHDERAEYAEMAKDDEWGIRAGVHVFCIEKMRMAKGDVARAVRMYNGSGDAAHAYQGEVLAWLAGTYSKPQNLA